MSIWAIANRAGELAALSIVDLRMLAAESGFSPYAAKTECDCKGLHSKGEIVRYILCREFEEPLV